MSELELLEAQQKEIAERIAAIKLKNQKWYFRLETLNLKIYLAI